MIIVLCSNIVQLLWLSIMSQDGSCINCLDSYVAFNSTNCGFSNLNSDIQHVLYAIQDSFITKRLKNVKELYNTFKQKIVYYWIRKELIVQLVCHPMHYNQMAHANFQKDTVVQFVIPAWTQIKIIVLLALLEKIKLHQMVSAYVNQNMACYNKYANLAPLVFVLIVNQMIFIPVFHVNQDQIEQQLIRNIFVNKSFTLNDKSISFHRMCLQ
ncbi:unnamed protein product [Paramecium octaurelia]|uniref:Transmembrane protein n=1 Tax=Paramecium octaurelia TaxID=43137 RepID=A0A8S1SX61_PAROT|nr:unnamed protein product [Paramecium octaurelia]